MTVEEIVESYGDMLYRICVVILCNEQDAQDAVQETFCRYMEHSAKFHSKEHEKAWLIKVATNIFFSGRNSAVRVLCPFVRMCRGYPGFSQIAPVRRRFLQGCLRP